MKLIQELTDYLAAKNLVGPDELARLRALGYLPPSADDGTSNDEPDAEPAGDSDQSNDLSDAEYPHPLADALIAAERRGRLRAKARRRQVVRRRDRLEDCDAALQARVADWQPTLDPLLKLVDPDVAAARRQLVAGELPDPMVLEGRLLKLLRRWHPPVVELANAVLFDGGIEAAHEASARLSPKNRDRVRHWATGVQRLRPGSDLPAVRLLAALFQLQKMTYDAWWQLHEALLRPADERADAYKSALVQQRRLLIAFILRGWLDGGFPDLDLTATGRGPAYPRLDDHDVGLALNHFWRLHRGDMVAFGRHFTAAIDRHWPDPSFRALRHMLEALPLPSWARHWQPGDETLWSDGRRVDAEELAFTRQRFVPISEPDAWPPRGAPALALFARPGFRAARPFAGGFAAVQLDHDGRWGFLTADGAVKFAGWQNVGDFSDGLAAVQRPNGRWGLIDRDGQIALTPQYTAIGAYREGFVPVERPNGTWTYLWRDRTARGWCLREAHDLHFHSAQPVYEGRGRYSFLRDGVERFSFIVPRWRAGRPPGMLPDYAGAHDFREGRAAVCDDNGRWGFIDPAGREVIPCIYEWVWSFSEGFAAVRRDGQWGIIDLHGHELLPCQYAMTEPFSGGYGGFYDGEWYFVDAGGRRSTYGHDETGGYSDGYSWVRPGWDTDYVLLDRQEEIWALDVAPDQPLFQVKHGATVFRDAVFGEWFLWTAPARVARIVLRNFYPAPFPDEFRAFEASRFAAFAQINRGLTPYTLGQEAFFREGFGLVQRHTFQFAFLLPPATAFEFPSGCTYYEAAGTLVFHVPGRGAHWIDGYFMPYSDGEVLRRVEADGAYYWELIDLAATIRNLQNE